MLLKARRQQGGGKENSMNLATEASPLSNLSTALGDAVAAAAPGIVRIDRRRGAGTGIAWSEDLVVTSSFHAPDATTVAFEVDGALVERDATVIGRDPGTDLAVMRVAGGGLTPAKLRDLDGVSVGQLVLALGRPGRTVRASLRIIGTLGTEEIRTPSGGRLDRWIETDRQIPRGFGGGPLVDPTGAVLALNTRTLVRGADLAIPVSTIRRVVAEIVAHGGVRRGYFGVGAYPIADGALVASLDADGPAAKAGLLVGDVIVKLGGEPITGPLDLRGALLDRGGHEVDVELIRAGAPLTIRVTIGSRP
jgi:S1-C subfamily serine protease